MNQEVSTTGVLPKLSKLREKLVHCDWSPDGSMKISGTVIKYISIAQIKASLAPLFSEFGLEFIPSMQKPEFNSESRQWLAGVDFRIMDVESEDVETFTYYGAASGEKGLVVATTYALKTALTTMFCLADGIDPDKENATYSTYVPKSQRETEEITSKIISQGVKPTQEAAQAPKAEAPAPKVEAPAPKAAEPAQKPSAPVSGAPISTMQGRTILNILTKLEAIMSAEELAAVKAEADQCRTSDAARAFITRYREKV